MALNYWDEELMTRLEASLENLSVGSNKPQQGVLPATAGVSSSGASWASAQSSLTTLGRSSVDGTWEAASDDTATLPRRGWLLRLYTLCDEPHPPHHLPDLMHLQLRRPHRPCPDFAPCIIIWESGPVEKVKRWLWTCLKKVVRKASRLVGKALASMCACCSV